MTLKFDHTTLGQRVLFGTGRAAENAVAALADLRTERVLLIADHYVEETADAISARTQVVGRIREVTQHVPSERAEEAVALATAASADVVLTIGGGSSTGLAKIIARDTGIPIVAVPTTFAGSEATNVWGITEANRKRTGANDKVLPKVVVYDAALSATMPAHLATASGLNAIAHAVDGFWAPRADPINRALGSEGLSALVRGLRQIHKDPTDIEARELTLYGAYLAAVAFASAGSGMHHKICHVLGGAYGLSHAEMHAIVLGYVAAFNAPASPDAAERVSSALGGAAPGGGLYALRAELGVIGSLAELGLKENDIPEAAELAFEAIPLSNPRPVTHADIESIIRSAWAGDPIT